jgi:hypothetical protein
MNLDRRASFLLPLSLVGCRADRSPQSVAEAFLDRYYVERDAAKAQALTAGAATERLKAELSLLEGARGGGLGAQPRVYYKRVSEQVTGGLHQLVYRLKIDANGVKLERDTVLGVQREGEGYRVVSFQEKDAAAAP